MFLHSRICDMNLLLARMVSFGRSAQGIRFRPVKVSIFHSYMMHRELQRTIIEKTHIFMTCEKAFIGVYCNFKDMMLIVFVFSIEHLHNKTMEHSKQCRVELQRSREMLRSAGEISTSLRNSLYSSFIIYLFVC